MQDESECVPTFPFSNHLQAICSPSFVSITKPVSNKIGETFCESLKCRGGSRTATSSKIERFVKMD